MTGWKDSSINFFISAMIAECVSCVLWVPIDVVKERLQIQSVFKTYNYKNSVDAVSQIYKKEGLRNLYKAYGATVMSFGPFTGINLTLYDKFKSKNYFLFFSLVWLGRVGHPPEVFYALFLHWVGSSNCHKPP